MTIQGNCNLWLELTDNLVTMIVSLITESWESFTPPDKLLEVRITNKLRVHLCRNKDRSIHPFMIAPDSTVLDEEGKEIGRIDLCFFPGHNEQVYFSLECKRLRVIFPGGSFNNLSAEYVTKGMYRYFNGQYATGLDKGGMLGYVMDGDTEAAKKYVKMAIEKKRGELYMAKTGTLSKSRLFPRNGDIKETLHQYGPNGSFVIHHIFLPLTAS